MGMEAQKQMASGAGGGATDAIIVRPELGGGDTGLFLSQSLGGGVLCDEPGLMGGGFRPSKSKSD